jgi:transcription initiation factor TFIID subunit 6
MQATARATLVTLVEEHLSQLIQQADSVKRHCKRARLCETEYDRVSTRRRLHAADINMALQMQNSEKLYGNVIPSKMDPATPVNLRDFLQQPLPAAPSEVGLRMHWLAVDGVQPDIPQNPAAATSEVTAVGTVSSDDEGESGVRINKLQASLLSEELQLYFSRVTLAMERGAGTPAAVKQQDSIVASVATDKGLQELVPFLVRYCQHELFAHTGNVEHCRTLVRLAMALLQNPHLHLELHMHELLPALMTCVVAKRLAGATGGANHYALRREAATALVHACLLFGDEYATLKARVLRTLCNATAPDQALASRYGGLVAIALFGTKAIDAFVLPVAASSWKQWMDRLAVVEDPVEETAIRMCQQVVLEALGLFFRQVSDAEKAARLDWKDLEETFGDSLAVLHGDPSEYATCFI